MTREATRQPLDNRLCVWVPVGFAQSLPRPSLDRARGSVPEVPMQITPGPVAGSATGAGLGTR